MKVQMYSNVDLIDNQRLLNIPISQNLILFYFQHDPLFTSSEQTRKDKTF